MAFSSKTWRIETKESKIEFEIYGGIDDCSSYENDVDNSFDYYVYVQVNGKDVGMICYNFKFNDDEVDWDIDCYGYHDPIIPKTKFKITAMYDDNHNEITERDMIKLIGIEREPSLLYEVLREVEKYCNLQGAVEIYEIFSNDPLGYHEPPDHFIY